jgi:tetratricopeptide (TPR) repeat protein
VDDESSLFTGSSDFAMNRERSATEKFRLLRAAWRADMPALTVVRAREYLADDPDKGPAWMLLGSALTDLARYDEARDALARAFALCPAGKRQFMYREIGHFHKARGRYARAAEWYRRMIEAEPENAGGYIFLGCVLARQGRLGEAEDVHRAGTACAEGCIDEAYLNLGLVLRAQERLIEAKECFERALELDPDYQAAREALRDVRRTLRFLREAQTSPSS